MPRAQNPTGWSLAAAMLSAFTARPIIELKQRDKSKIDSILAHGMRLVLSQDTNSSLYFS